MATVADVATNAATDGSQNQPRKVLHLIGSRQDEFYFDLSLLYARACDSCEALDRKRFHFRYALVHLDGSWSFPVALSEEAVAEAPHIPISDAIGKISEIAPDVMVPHMFCVEGMTRYRSLFDLLQIPFLGNHEYTVWPATDKATTKQLLDAAGVTVPRGELLVKGQKEKPESVQVPFVVKPCNEDNSRGITLVREQEDAKKALDYAFSFDPRVVVDEYIAGREVRAAVIEEIDGTLTVLPKIEYFLQDIRTSAHKLATTDGKLNANAIKEAKRDGDRQCPADLSPEIHARIDESVVNAHKTLKCRHYSLFDIRINADGIPYILEAAFFCSFSPLSVIPAMCEHSGRADLKHPAFFHSLLERVTNSSTGRELAFAPPVRTADPIAAVPTADTLQEITTPVNSASSQSEGSESGEGQ